ncbi:scavenger receptor cysteine-rich domain-containing protein DMBT1-like [Diadema setosum]|uniref:scavenger receptor cysteine-rich domain-containing protein DMBT1-like n=1 Tax=Diadema setosum TaxID=31175 RepID=UPI003B3BB77A
METSGERTFNLESGESVTIASPNFPQPYDDSTEITWAVTVPEGCGMVLRFGSFSTERDFDKLTVRDNSDLSGVVDEFHGEVVPPNAHYAFSSALITFSSDYSVTADGFEAVISAKCTVRLVNGETPREGRVEVYANGAWGTVCDDSWDLHDAEVVCTRLGYRGAEAALTNAVFGQGTGNIWLDDVSCTGTETSIFYCGSNGIGVHNCEHSEDAGVRCSIDVRLVNGETPREGRVEVYANGAWGTVCDNYWDLDDAEVVCTSLGFSGAEDALTNAAFGLGTGNIWLDDVSCTGTETSIFECGNNGIGVHNCAHFEDAGVKCSIDAYSQLCPLGWSLLGNNCYRMFTGAKTYNEAVLACTNENGDLAVAKTPEVHNLLASFTLDARISAYIGLSDVAEEDRFVWTDGSPLEDAQK